MRRFQAFTGGWPWDWVPGQVEAFIAGGGWAHSTVRSYQGALSCFLGFVTDPRYGWVAECEQRVGTRPVQVCHEGNTAVHVSAEGRPARRPLTRVELQAFFDAADDRVEQAGRTRRKGWLAAFRDATLFKVVYGWGLRRREAVMLDVADFTVNPGAPQLGRFGICQVRFGKAMRGSPPRRRAVATVLPWTAEALEQYVSEVRPRYGADGQSALLVTERGDRMSARSVDDRFALWRAAAGLPAELSVHCLRHSYVSHLIEDGVDPLFVQPRSGTPGRRRRRRTRRSARTRRTGCCSRRWPGCWPARPGPRGAADDGAGGLSLASSAADGRARHVRHHRPGPVARRAGGRRCPGSRSTGWWWAGRSGCRCRRWPRCATSWAAHPGTWSSRTGRPGSRPGPGRRRRIRPGRGGPGSCRPRDPRRTGGRGGPSGLTPAALARRRLVIDAVAGRSLPRPVVTAAVDAVVTHPAVLRDLAAAFRADPHALATGAPPAVGRLADQLIAGGATTVTRPTCVRCGRIGYPLTRSAEGGVCGRCRRRQLAAACVRCQVVKPVAMRDGDGEPVCARCSDRPQRRCGSCGQVRAVGRRAGPTARTSA